jgi:hypothetical protein
MANPKDVEEITTCGHWRAEIEDVPGADQAADDLDDAGVRAAAAREVPGMVRVLLEIANDKSGAAGPRVAAARAVCELGGLLGPVKEVTPPLAKRDIREMSLPELEEFISQGQRNLFGRDE